MSNNKFLKVGLTKATYLAALNAVVARLEAGDFMSEFQVGPSNSTLDTETDTGMWVWGRTNTGQPVQIIGRFFAKHSRGKKEFPGEKVIMDVRGKTRGDFLGYFLITFPNGRMKIDEVDREIYISNDKF